MKQSLFLTIAALACGSALQAQATADEVRRGHFDGATAGSRTSLFMPFAIATGSGITMAALYDAPVTNNRIVTQLLAQSAISVGLTWAVGKALPPRPSKEQRDALALAPPAYTAAWRRAFREAASNRRFLANSVGLVVGAGVSAAIYKLRAGP